MSDPGLAKLHSLAEKGVFMLGEREENGEEEEEPRPEDICAEGVGAVKKEKYLHNSFLSTIGQREWDRSGHVDLNTHIDAVRNTSVKDALRELTQNFMDSCTTARGKHANGPTGQPTYEHLKLSTEEYVVKHRGVPALREPPPLWTDRRTGTVMWTDNTRYGQITKRLAHPAGKKLPFSEKKAAANCPEVHYGSLEFTNYGAVLPSIDHLLCYGVTSKTDYANQTGRFGEGFCRAVTKLLSHNVGVEFRGLVNGTSGTMCQKWRFYLAKKKVGCQIGKAAKHGTFHCHLDKIAPMISILLTWKVGLHNPGPEALVEYNIYDFLTPRAALRNPLSPDEPGIILQDGDSRAKIYVQHILVVTYRDTSMRWGYNFFNAKVPRNRDSMDIAELYNQMINCLSYSVVEDGHFADMYFDLLLQCEDDCDYMEVRIRIVDSLTLEARQTLAGIYTNRFPEAVPITPASQSIRCQLSKHQTIPVHLHKIICGTERNNLVPSLDEELVKARNGIELLLIRIPDAWSDITELFRGIVDIVQSELPGPIRFVCDDDKQRLWVDVHKFPDSKESILNDLVCSVMPYIFEDNCDLTSLFAKLKNQEQSDDFHHTTTNEPEDRPIIRDLASHKRSADEGSSTESEDGLPENKRQRRGGVSPVDVENAMMTLQYVTTDWTEMGIELVRVNKQLDRVIANEQKCKNRINILCVERDEKARSHEERDRFIIDVRAKIDAITTITPK